MARIAGRNARVYMGIASGGTAEPIAFQAEWSINFTTPKIDVTAFGDTNKVTVAGLPEATGAFSGFYDDSTAQAYTAATDGVARKFYLYPNISTAQYFFGTVNPDVSLAASVSGAATVSSNWEAASTIAKVG
jgi:hypothetical protein